MVRAHTSYERWWTSHSSEIMLKLHQQKNYEKSNLLDRCSMFDGLFSLFLSPYYNKVLITRVHQLSFPYLKIALNQYCFSCYEFGHKALECKSHGRRSSRRSSYSMRCWRCNYYGHIAKLQWDSSSIGVIIFLAYLFYTYSRPRTDPIFSPFILPKP